MDGDLKYDRTNSDESLNGALPLGAWYKMLVKDFGRQNKYIDKLEAEIERLKMEVKSVEHDARRRRVRLQNSMRDFMVAHRGKDVTLDDINALFDSYDEKVFNDKRLKNEGAL